MARELTMPKLSDSMEEATILHWLKEPGESFARGEPLAEIETDKATVVYEAETDGVLASILVPEGGSARMGEPIAKLDGDAPQAKPESEPAPERARATPVARRRAVELGVSLHELEGSGPGGRITVDDVEAAAGDQPAPGPGPAAGAKGEVETIELTSTQKTIARRMEQAALTSCSFSRTTGGNTPVPIAPWTERAPSTPLSRLRTSTGWRRTACSSPGRMRQHRAARLAGVLC